MLTICTAVICAFVLGSASSPSSAHDAAEDHHRQRQVPEPVQEPNAEQSSPSPPPSHSSISSIAEAHRLHHQPGGSQPAISVAPSQAQPNNDQLRVCHFSLRVSPNSETVVHFHAIDIDPPALPAEDDARNAEQLRPLNLGKMFVSLTFQAIVSFTAFRYSSSDNIASLQHAQTVSTLLNLAVVVIVVGFTVTLIGLVIREIYIELAMILEKAGSASATLGFFLLMATFLTKVSMVIALLGGVGSSFAFVVVFIKMIKKKNRTRSQSVVFIK